MKTAKISLAILVAILFQSFGFAKDGSVKGRVSDEKKELVAYATVALLSAKDSSMVKINATNEIGEFNFISVPDGRYLVNVSMVGYEKFYTEVFEVKGNTYDVPNIVLKTSAATLGEVEVRTKKPMLEVKADRTVFNIENTINATGSNALELLKKAPGVVVDNNDNIALQGKSGVVIYIDGRPSPLSQDDLAAMLKSVQASQIASIEIITNPSAKYDAAGSAGIINIKFRKDKRYGTNGTAELGGAYGYYPKGNAGLSVNHRNEKTNLFGSYNVYAGKNRNWMNLYRSQADSVDGRTLIFDQEGVTVDNNVSQNIRLGADYFINSKNTLGFIADGSFTKGPSNTASSTPISAWDGVANTPLAVLNANSGFNSQKSNANFNLNYRFEDTTGTTFNVDADYGLFVNRDNNLIENKYMNPTQSAILQQVDFRTYMPTDIRIYTFKTDYERSLFGGKMGVGAKASYVTTDNKLDFYNVENSIETIDTNRTNKFSYTENINALYLNYNRNLGKKWSFQTGLRAEQTNSHGTLTALDASQNKDTKRTYLDWFPSAALSYNMSQKHAFNLNYSRRINRPNYQTLNPFEYRIDDLTYMKGNEFLRPQYSHSVSLTHTFMYFINTSVSYSKTNDFFGEITDSIDVTRNLIMTKNLTNQQTYGINISSPLQIKKWWTGFVNMGYSNMRNRADFGEGKKIDLTVNSFNLYLSQNFVLPKNFQLECSGFYSSPSIWGGNVKTRSFWMIDLGAQWQYKKRLTIKLTVPDFLYVAKWSGNNDFSGVKINASGGWESRQIRLNLTYRFGGEDVKGSRERTTGIEDEAGRTKKK